MSYGLKVSKPGKSVYSTNQQDLSFDSSFQAIMRLVDSGSGNQAIASGATGQVTTVTVAHNLGYAPFFQAFISWDEGAGDTEIEAATTGSVDPSTGTITFSAKVDATNLYLRWHNLTPVPGISSKYYYFIGRDPAV